MCYPRFGMVSWGIPLAILNGVPCPDVSSVLKTPILAPKHRSVVAVDPAYLVSYLKHIIGK